MGPYWTLALIQIFAGWTGLARFCTYISVSRVKQERLIRHSFDGDVVPRINSTNRGSRWPNQASLMLLFSHLFPAHDRYFTPVMHLSRLLPRGVLSRSSFTCLPKLRPWRSFSKTRILAIDSLDMETVDTTERLNGLRHLMSENKIDVYSMIQRQFLWKNRVSSFQVVPSEDSHQSEYIAPCDARRG